MRNFKHLEKIEVVEFDWKNNLFNRALPARAFTNTVTMNLVRSCESILTESITQIGKIKSYFNI